MKRSLVSVISICLGLTILGGCARDISSGSYGESSVGEVASTYACTVVSVRKVKINGQDKLGSNTLGIIGGGAAGGVLGNMIGQGKGRTLATAAGVLVGTTAGAYAQKHLEEQAGYEYTVKMEDGKLRTVVQGLDNPLNPGQLAYLMVYSNGRSRVIAR